MGGNEDLGRSKEENREAPPPMADDYRKKSGSSLFSSPKLFTTQKSFTDPDSLMSPTSILDSKSSFSALRNPFWSDYSTTTTTPPKTPRPDQKVHRPVGLGLVVVDDDSPTLNKESDSDPNSKSKSKSDPCPVVLFGSQLKIQIPLLLHHHHHPSVTSPLDSPISPADFGIKKSPVHSSISPVFSPCSSSSAKKSPFGSSNSTRDFSSLSISEMELSEEYTRVISRGPNPKTTHIFDDCVVVESSSSSSSSYGGCCNNLETSSKGNNNNSNDFPISRSMSYPSENFLSFCYKCKNNLGQGKDIYMYR